MVKHEHLLAVVQPIFEPSPLGERLNGSLQLNYAPKVRCDSLLVMPLLLTINFEQAHQQVSVTTDLVISL